MFSSGQKSKLLSSCKHYALLLISSIAVPIVDFRLEFWELNKVISVQLSFCSGIAVSALHPLAKTITKPFVDITCFGI